MVVMKIIATILLVVYGLAVLFGAIDSNNLSTAIFRFAIGWVMTALLAVALIWS